MASGMVVAVNGQADVELAEAATIEVHERLGETTTYALHLPIGIEAGDLPMLIDDRLAPGTNLSLLASVGGGADCLVSGPITGHGVRLQDGGDGSTLAVYGSDRSIEMDRETRSALWANLTDDSAVTAIVGGYGFVPDTESTSGAHLEAKHALVQRDSDLRFVRRLAARNGFAFWVTCDPFGIETAHFKRVPLDGGAAAKLVINQQPAEANNLTSIDFTWDVERPTSVIGAQLDLNALTTLDGAVAVSPLTTLGGEGLADIAPGVRSVHLLAPADDAGDLQARGEGALIEAGWFIEATCATSLHRLGSLMHAHTLVEVQGVGSRYSGNYLVAAVDHYIDGAAHRMTLTLIRNGWGA